MKNKDVPSTLFATIGRDPSEKFADPEGLTPGTRQVARTEEGAWLALCEDETTVTLAAYATESEARGSETISDCALIEVMAAPAQKGEMADCDGVALSIRASTDCGIGGWIDVHSPEFITVIEILSRLKTLRYSVPVLKRTP
jgi:hypothetical protein